MIWGKPINAGSVGGANRPPLEGGRLGGMRRADSLLLPREEADNGGHVDERGPQKERRGERLSAAAASLFAPSSIRFI